MRSAFHAVAISVFFTTSVNAEELPADYTAERMYELCTGTVRGEDKNMQSMVCTFRLQGIVTMMVENCLSTSRGYSPIPLLTSNPPPSRGAARQAFTNFMEDNPDKWGLPFHAVVALAISETFPCNP